MAIGDDALAAGMDILTGNELANTLDTEENKTRDYIAQRTNAITPVVKGGTGANSAAAARNNLDVYGKGETYSRAQTYDRPTVDNAFTQRDNAIGQRASQVDLNYVQAGNLTPDVYNRALGGSRRALWVQSDGVIGYAASTERYKTILQPVDVTDEQLALLTVVCYEYRAPVATDGHTEVGLIAERLVDAGLGWAVFYNEGGTPEGINYELVGVALVPVIQRLLLRVAALEAL